MGRGQGKRRGSAQLNATSASLYSGYWGAPVVGVFHRSTKDTRQLAIWLQSPNDVAEGQAIELHWNNGRVSRGRINTVSNTSPKEILIRNTEQYTLRLTLTENPGMWRTDLGVVVGLHQTLQLGQKMVSYSSTGLPEEVRVTSVGPVVTVISLQTEEEFKFIRKQQPFHYVNQATGQEVLMKPDQTLARVSENTHNDASGNFAMIPVVNDDGWILCFGTGIAQYSLMRVLEYINSLWRPKMDALGRSKPSPIEKHRRREGEITGLVMLAQCRYQRCEWALENGRYEYLDPQILWNEARMKIHDFVRQGTGKGEVYDAGVLWALEKDPYAFRLPPPRPQVVPRAQEPHPDISPSFDNIPMPSQPSPPTSETCVVPPTFLDIQQDAKTIIVEKSAEVGPETVRQSRKGCVVVMESSVQTDMRLPSFPIKSTSELPCGCDQRSNHRVLVMR